MRIVDFAASRPYMYYIYPSLLEVHENPLNPLNIKLIKFISNRLSSQIRRVRLQNLIGRLANGDSLASGVSGGTLRLASLARDHMA